MTTQVSQRSQWQTWLLVLVVLVLAIGWPTITHSNHLISVGALALTFAVLSQALNLVYGYAGFFSLATTVFWGIGGYTSARLAVSFGVDPLLAILASGTLAAMVAALFGVLSMRQGRDAFAILSLVFALFAALLASTWVSVTNGTQGIAGLPPIPVGPASWDVVIFDESDFYYATLALAAGSLALIYLAVSSRWGKVLLATKTDEQLAASFGIHLLRERVRAIALGAFFCGLVGGMHAFRITVVDPSLLSLVYLAPLLAGLLLGGPGSFWGNIGATVFVVLAAELTREFGTSRNLIYGAILLVLTVAFPQGLPATIQRLWRDVRRRGNHDH
jgi:branched-chain amino acid transport system permease protein